MGPTKKIIIIIIIIRNNNNINNSINNNNLIFLPLGGRGKKRVCCLSGGLSYSAGGSYDLAGMSHFNVWDFQPLLSVGLTMHCLTSA